MLYKQKYINRGYNKKNKFYNKKNNLHDNIWIICKQKNNMENQVQYLQKKKFKHYKKFSENSTARPTNFLYLFNVRDFNVSIV